MSNNCIGCKYFEQVKYFEHGKFHSFCGNDKQKDENLKQYAYWPFSCDLFEEGISESRIKFNESIKANKNFKNDQA